VFIFVFTFQPIFFSMVFELDSIAQEKAKGNAIGDSIAQY
jgi:hypothetical protein